MTPPSNAGGEGREVLLGCPICGEQPRYNGRSRVGGYLCSGPGEGVGMIHRVQSYGADESEARAAWNRRPARENADDRAPALVEAAVAEMREKAAKVGDAVADAILDLLAETGTVTDARAAAHMAAEAIADRIRALPTPSQEASNVG